MSLSPDEQLQEALNDVRAQALQEVARWHEGRARLLKNRPGFGSETAQEAEKIRAEENLFAANYLLNLPEVENRKDDLAVIGTDASTAAFQILYERPLQETNAQFLARAEELIQAAINAGAAKALEEVREIEDEPPSSWRLEKVTLVGAGSRKFKANLWRRGGLTAEGHGPTTRKAVQVAVQEAYKAESLEKKA
jgi:hypothetical protein